MMNTQLYGSGDLRPVQGKKFDAPQPINDHNTYMNIGYLQHG